MRLWRKFCTIFLGGLLKNSSIYIEDYHQLDQAFFETRRKLTDRRQNNINVTNDRRKGSRRSGDIPDRRSNTDRREGERREIIRKILDNSTEKSAEIVESKPNIYTPFILSLIISVTLFAMLLLFNTVYGDINLLKFFENFS